MEGTHCISVTTTHTATTDITFEEVYIKQEPQDVFHAKCKKEDTKEINCANNISEIDVLDNSKDIDDNHGNDKPNKLKCYICNKIFRQESNLKIHLKLHSGGREMKCPICTKLFLTKRYLFRHIKSHKGIKDYQCHECNKLFLRKERLLIHMKICLTCNICNITFKHKSDLQTHLQLHYVGKRFKCLICNKILGTKNQLKQHIMVIHSSTKNFLCSICGKMFRHRKDLTDHLNRHAGPKKNYECKICNKSLSSKHSLILHLKVHSDVKEFECSICRKQFRYIVNLNTHMKIHQRKFECGLCKTRFKDELHWNSHMEEHRIEESYLNNICLENTQLQPNNKVIISSPENSSTTLSENIVQKQTDNTEIEHSFKDIYITNEPQVKMEDQKEITIKEEFVVQSNQDRQIYESLLQETSQENDRTIWKHNSSIEKTLQDMLCCPVCSKTFTTEHDLLFHVNKHEELNFDSNSSTRTAHQTETTQYDTQLRTKGLVIENQLHKQSPNLESQLNTNEATLGFHLNTNNATLGSQLQSDNVNQLQTEGTMAGNQLQRGNDIANQLQIDVTDLKTDLWVQLQKDEITTGFQLHTNINQLQTEGTMAGNQLQKDNDIANQLQIDVTDLKTDLGVQLQKYEITMGFQLHTTINQLQTEGIMAGNQLQIDVTDLKTDLGVQLQKDEIITGFQLHTKINQLQTEGTMPGNQLQRDNDIANQLQIDVTDLKTDLGDQLQNDEITTGFQLHTNINQLQTEGTMSGNQLQKDEATTSSQLNKNEEIIPKQDNQSNPVRRKLRRCPICYEIFTQTELDKHVKKYKDMKNISFSETCYKSRQCPICDKLFQTNWKAFYHLKLVHIGMKQFKCSQCTESFTTIEKREDHMSNHTGTKSYNCPVCYKSFRLNIRLRKHMKYAGDMDHLNALNKMKKIRIRQTEDSIEEKKKNKQNSTVPVQKFEDSPKKCPLCSETFTNSENFGNHIKKYKNVKNIYKLLNDSNNCPICGKMFVQRVNIIRHIKSVHIGFKEYQCSECNKSYTDKHSLQYHMTRHTGIKNYKCPVCNKPFKVNTILRKHMKNMTDAAHLKAWQDMNPVMEISWKLGTPRKCPVCTETFTNAAVLDKHMRKYKNNKNLTFNKRFYLLKQCPICDKVFKNKSNMGRHVKSVHIGLKQYQCSECNQSFTDKNSLQYHMTKHTGIKNYKCPVCDMRFQVKYTLRRHLRNMKDEAHRKAWKSMNPGTKNTAEEDVTEIEEDNENEIKLDLPRNCPICPETFTNAEDLDDHMKKYKNNNKLTFNNHFYLLNQCPVCDQVFKSKGNIVRHVKTVHIGVKQYQCLKCNQSYTDKNSLQYHMTKHTGIKKYKCPVCYKRFQVNTILRRHVKNMKDKAHRKAWKNMNPDMDNTEEEDVTEIEEDDQNEIKLDIPRNCPVCTETFTNAEDLDDHMKTYKNNKKLAFHNHFYLLNQCPVCDKVIAKIDHLIQHIKSVHIGRKDYQCLHCNNSYSNKYSLEYHMTEHTGIKKYKCFVCDESFKVNYILRKHLRKMKDAAHLKAWQDINSGKKLPEEDSTQIEGLEITEEEDSTQIEVLEITGEEDSTQIGLKMEITEEEDSTQIGLKMEITEEEDSTAVEKCDKKKIKLETPRNCPVCTETFTNAQDLDEHMQKYKNNKNLKINKRFYLLNQCPICDKTFKSKGSITRHVKTIHIGLKEYQCSECNQSFTEKNSLQYHMTIHTGIKKYKCPVCNKRFQVNTMLRKHMRNMKDEAHRQVWKNMNPEITEKEDATQIEEDLTEIEEDEIKLDIPRNCPICTETFSNAEDLDKHMKRYKNVKKFMFKKGINKSNKCPVCDKVFKNNARTIQRHIKIIHIGIRPYKCSQCSKSFTGSESLEYHMAIHSGVKKYQCPVCYKYFRIMRRLKIHMRNKGDSRHLKALEATRNNYNNTNLTSQNQNITVSEDINELHEEYLSHCEVKMEDENEITIKEEFINQRNQDRQIYESLLQETSQESDRTIWKDSSSNENTLQNTSCCSVCSKTFTTEHDLVFHLNKHEEHNFDSNSSTSTANQAETTQYDIASTRNQLQTEGTMAGNQLQSDNGALKSQFPALFSHLLSGNTVNQLQIDETKLGTDLGDQLQKDETPTGFQLLTNINQLQTEGTTAENQLQIDVTKLGTDLGVQLQKYETPTGFLYTNINQLQTEGTMTGNQLQRDNDIVNQLQIDVTKFETDLGDQLQKDETQTGFQLHTTLNQLQTGSTMTWNQLQIDVTKYETDLGDQLQKDETLTGFQLHTTINQLQTEGTMAGNQLQRDNGASTSQVFPNILSRLLAGNTVNQLQIDGSNLKTDLGVELQKDEATTSSQLNKNEEIVYKEDNQNNPEHRKSRKCPLCNEIFTSATDLDKHMKKYINNKNITFNAGFSRVRQCPVCDKILKSDMIRHVKLFHIGLKEYRCSECNKLYASTRSLEYHMTVHTGQSKYKCTVCDKTFKVNNRLKKHMRKMGDYDHLQALNNHKDPVSKKKNSTKKSHKIEEIYIKTGPQLQTDNEVLVLQLDEEQKDETVGSHLLNELEQATSSQPNENEEIVPKKDNQNNPEHEEIYIKTEPQLQTDNEVLVFQLEEEQKDETVGSHLLNELEQATSSQLNENEGIVPKKDNQNNPEHEEIYIKTEPQLQTDNEVLVVQLEEEQKNETVGTHLLNELEHATSSQLKENEEIVPKKDNQNNPEHEEIYIKTEPQLQTDNEVLVVQLEEEQKDETVGTHLLNELEHATSSQLKENEEIVPKKDNQNNPEHEEIYIKTEPQLQTDNEVLSFQLEEGNTNEDQLQKDETWASYLLNKLEQATTSSPLNKKEDNQNNAKHRKSRKCPICYEIFTNVTDLDTHMKKYVNKKNITFNTGFSRVKQCPVCDKILKSDMIRHVKLFHIGVKDYRCSECNKLFATTKGLEYHMTVHMEQRNYKCTVCDKTFKLNRRLIEHMRKKVGDYDHLQALNNYNKSVSKKKNSTNPSHKIEEIYIKTEPQLQTDNEVLGVQLKESTNDDQLQKDKTWASYLLNKLEQATTSSPLNKKEDNQNNPEHRKSRKCPICNEIFTSATDLDNHMKKYINNRKIRFLPGFSKMKQCPVCDKMFTCVIRHIKQVHIGFKDYSCSKCNKLFATKVGLEYHMTAHTGEINYKCIVCDKSFKVNGKLKKHMRKMGDYDHLQALNNHKKISKKKNSTKTSHKTKPQLQTDEVLGTQLEEESANEDQWQEEETVASNLLNKLEQKYKNKQNPQDIPEKCPFCGAEFLNFSPEMKQHIESHIGTKNYCTTCNKSFSRESYFKQHMSVHLGVNETYKCPLCQRVYQLQSSLKTHMKSKDSEHLQLFNEGYLQDIP